jgi:mono/diheme cytochrome c family protein
MLRVTEILAIALVLPLMSPARTVSGAADRPALGAVVDELRFVDTRGLPRGSGELGAARALVLMFTTNDCPLAQRYLPKYIELQRRIQQQGLEFLVVNVGPRDTVLSMAERQVESGAAFPFVKDFDGTVARGLGVTRTPEFVILDGARRLVYRGRFDAQYRLGGVSPSAGRADLERALEDVLAGRAVEVAETIAEGCALEDLGPPAPRPDLTWSRDIAPIVQESCQGCHRAGTAAPFALDSYDDVAARRATIAEVVHEGRMPPWFASPRHGEFVNAPRMTDEQRAQLIGWARAGAPAGDLSAAPAPIERTDSRWRIGEPDLVLEQAGVSSVPAEGYIPYRYILFPHVFAHDTWVEAIEITSDNLRVVHHANLAHFRLTESYKTENFLTGYVPGGDPLVCDPGVAVLIPAGSLLGLQTHFVTTGRAERAKLSIGLRFPRGVVQQRLRHFQIHTSRFEIPAFAPAHRVRAERKFGADALGVGMFAHMHLRGRDMTFRATYPDGREEVLLCVPNYNFDWQQSYRWAPRTRRFPAGTRVDVVAHFDNSRFNPYNPDPTVAVRFGQQSVDEMMYGFLFFVEEHERLNLAVDTSDGKPR